MSDEMFEGLVPEPPAPPAPPGPPVTPPPAPPGQSASPAAPPAPPYPPQYAQYGPPTESRSRGWIAALIVGIVLLVLICSCMATLAIIYLPHLVRAVEEPEFYNGPAPLDPYEEDSLAALERYWADPTDPNTVAEVGNAYYDWATDLEAAGDSEEAVAKWKLAILYYDQAIGMDPENDAVRGDRAFALYYIDDPDAAAALQSFIDHASDNTDLSPQVESAREYLAELE